MCTVALAAVVLAAGIFMLARFNDMVMPLVALWAMFGVGIHVADANMIVMWAIFAMCAITLVLFGLFLYRSYTSGSYARQ